MVQYFCKDRKDSFGATEYCFAKPFEDRFKRASLRDFEPILQVHNRKLDAQINLILI